MSSRSSTEWLVDFSSESVVSHLVSWCLSGFLVLFLVVLGCVCWFCFERYLAFALTHRLTLKRFQCFGAATVMEMVLGMSGPGVPTSTSMTMKLATHLLMRPLLHKVRRLHLIVVDFWRPWKCNTSLAKVNHRPVVYPGW